jgi:prepilin peptidase CpaA
MLIATIILVVLVPWLIILAATSDIFTMTIPNRLVLLLLVLFAVMAWQYALPLSQIGMHIGAFLLVLLVCFVLFALGVMGGGDAKFAAIMALWLGWAHTFEFLFIAALSGGLLTAIFVIAREMLELSDKIRWPFLKRLMNKKKGIPYGVALSLSGLWLFSQSFWLTSLFST